MLIDFVLRKSALIGFVAIFIVSNWEGQNPWGVVTFEKMTKPEAVSTLVLTNTPQ
jgi:hypothetical protein